MLLVQPQPDAFCVEAVAAGKPAHLLHQIKLLEAERALSPQQGIGHMYGFELLQEPLTERSTVLPEIIENLPNKVNPEDVVVGLGVHPEQEGIDAVETEIEPDAFISGQILNNYHTVAAGNDGVVVEVDQQQHRQDGVVDR